jgi:Cft2 family RNA processing exonuclease
MLYTEADLESSMDKIETINFHEEKDVFGIKFWAYNAGHVLGAAMFMIEIAGVKVLTIHGVCLHVVTQLSEKSSRTFLLL